jgi:hypothetical protein
MRTTVSESAVGTGIRAARETNSKALAGRPNHTLSAGQREELDRVPRKYRKLILKALQGTASPRRAIQANCLTCTHFNIDEIRECAVSRCVLRPYRPYQREGVDS